MLEITEVPAPRKVSLQEPEQFKKAWDEIRNLCRYDPNYTVIVPETGTNLENTLYYIRYLQKNQK